MQNSSMVRRVSLGAHLWILRAVVMAVVTVDIGVSLASRCRRRSLDMVLLLVQPGRIVCWMQATRGIRSRSPNGRRYGQTRSDDVQILAQYRAGGYDAAFMWG